MGEMVKAAKELADHLERARDAGAEVPTSTGTIVYNFAPTASGALAGNRTQGINHGSASIGAGGTGGNNGVFSIGTGGGSSGSGVIGASELERALRFFGIMGNEAKRYRENSDLAMTIVRLFLAELSRRGAIAPSLSDQLRIGGS